jgi:uracil-DNA glycosylase
MAVSLPELFSLLPREWRDELVGIEETCKDIDARLSSSTYVPSRSQIFAALQLPPTSISVVIIGQDPYPNPLDAMGVAFSVPQGRGMPASLRNLAKELENDCGIKLEHGNLQSWVTQGVLLWNPLLTTESGRSMAHADFGWEKLTQAILEIVAKNRPVVILLGKKAEKFQSIFNAELTIKAPHPSPLSAYRGFFGSKIFSRTNELLQASGKRTIDWRVDPQL